MEVQRQLLLRQMPSGRGVLIQPSSKANFIEHLEEASAGRLTSAFLEPFRTFRAIFIGLTVHLTLYFFVVQFSS